MVIQRLFASPGRSNEHSRRTGASRGQKGAPGEPRTGADRGQTEVRHEIWAAIDIDRASRVCIPQGVQPILWRRENGAPLSVYLKNAVTGKVASASFAKQKNEEPWPQAALPISSYQQYMISRSKNSTPVAITPVFIPPPLVDPVEIAATLIKEGCNYQLGLMIEGLDRGHSTDAGGPR